MSHNNRSQKIIQALEKVEHPAIATTLVDLGMVRDIVVSEDGKILLTLVLPFPNIPDNMRSYMINSLALAAQSEGGQLGKINLDMMNESDQQMFLAKEHQHWRG